MNKVDELDERVSNLEDQRPTDETIALADTFSKGLSQTDDVVNNHGKSIDDLYKLLKKIDQRLEKFIKYIKKLYEYTREKNKK